MEEKTTRASCLALLQRKQAELREAGEERYVTRGDFTPQEVVAIKAHLGPWPRALEAAEIKPPREDDDKAARNLQRRIQAKRARNQARKNGAQVSEPQKEQEK